MGTTGHDHRFENQEAIEGSYCIDCQRPCLPDTTRRCRSCRKVRTEKRVWTREQETRIDMELEHLVAIEALRQPNQPRDLEAAQRELEEQKKRVRAELKAEEAAGVRRSTPKNARRGLTETERATREAEARSREMRRAEMAEVVIAVCLLKSCSKTFERKRILQECCSRECSVAIERSRFKVNKPKAEPVKDVPRKAEEVAQDAEGNGAGLEHGDPVLGVPENGDAADRLEEPGPETTTPVADGLGGDSGILEQGPETRVLECVREDSQVQRDQSETEVEDMAATKTAPASRFTEEQLKWADEQNRPPHNRGHVSISVEMSTSQATLSKALREYREANGLDTPDVVANRKAAGQDSKNPDKKNAPKKAKPEKLTKPKADRPKKIKAAAKPKKEKKNPPEDTAEVPGTLTIAKKTTGKIVGISLEGVIADCERAKGELDGHKGACPDCADKVSANEFCMLGRAFASRWARLEFVAASA